MFFSKNSYWEIFFWIFSNIFSEFIFWKYSIEFFQKFLAEFFLLFWNQQIYDTTLGSRDSATAGCVMSAGEEELGILVIQVLNLVLSE